MLWLDIGNRALVLHQSDKTDLFDSPMGSLTISEEWMEMGCWEDGEWVKGEGVGTGSDM